MDKLTSWGENIINHCPVGKPGQGIYHIILERIGASGSSYNDYERGIRQLIAMGYLCKDDRSGLIWREPERVAVIQYLEHRFVTTRLDSAADAYVAIQLGISEDVAHGKRMQALRKLVNDGIVVANWEGTGEGGVNEFGTNRLRCYALKRWEEERGTTL